jgi:hypothetical protein
MSISCLKCSKDLGPFSRFGFLVCQEPNMISYYFVLHPQENFEFERSDCKIIIDEREQFPIIHCLGCLEAIGRKRNYSCFTFNKEKLLFGTFTVKKSDKWPKLLSINNELFSKFPLITMKEFPRYSMDEWKSKKEESKERNRAKEEMIKQLKQQQQQVQKKTKTTKKQRKEQQQQQQQQKQKQLEQQQRIQRLEQPTEDDLNKSKSRLESASIFEKKINQIGIPVPVVAKKEIPVKVNKVSFNFSSDNLELSDEKKEVGEILKITATNLVRYNQSRNNKKEIQLLVFLIWNKLIFSRR